VGEVAIFIAVEIGQGWQTFNNSSVLPSVPPYLPKDVMKG